MRMVARITPPPLSLPAMFARIVEEGPVSERFEQRLLAQLTRLEEKLNGNGSPGVFTRLRAAEDDIKRMREEREARELVIAEEKRQAILEKGIQDNKKQNSWWYRLLFQAATVAVALLLGALWNNYVNHTPTPVEKKIATETVEDKKRIDVVEEKLDTLIGRLPAMNNLRVPAQDRPADRRPVKRQPQPRPKGGAMLREGELITARDHLPPMLSYNHAFLPEIKAP